MKWFKRILISLVGLLVGLSLIIFSAIFILGESHYKQIMIWAAEQYLDSELIIEGPVKIDVYSNFILEAGNLNLIAHDGSYQLTTSSMQINLRVGPYLRKGNFWFNNINFDNAQLNLFEINNEVPKKYNDVAVPTIIVERANINNFTISYQEQAPGSLHSITFDELTLYEISEDKPITLQATGNFKGQSFFLDVTADSIAQVIDRIDPYKVQLNFSSPFLNLDLSGSVIDPINGHGLNLNIDTNVPDLTELMDILWDNVPPLGNLQGSFLVRGDYEAPILEEINLNILRKNEIDLTVTGSVANVLNGQGFNLQFETLFGNQDLINWLLFYKYEHIHTLYARGQLYGDTKQLSLRNLTVTADALDDVQIKAMGNVSIYEAGYRLKKSDATLKVEFKAPDLSAINTLKTDYTPNIGPVSGIFDLALSRDAIAIYNTTVKIGNKNGHLINLTGDIGYVQIFEPLVLSELELQTKLQTMEINQFVQYFGYTLPNFGPAQLQGKLITQGSEIILQNTNLKIGRENQTIIQASGFLATKLRNLKDFRINLDVKVEAMEASQLSKQFNYEVPKLGPLQLQGKLISQDSKLLLQNTRVVIGTSEKSIFRANGIVTTQIEDLKNFNVAMDIDIQSHEISQIAKMFEYHLPNLGSTHITGWLESSESEINFNNGLLVIGEVGQPSLRANFELNTQKQKGSTITAQFETAIAAWIKQYTSNAIKSLDYANGKFEFSNLDGKWGFESFSVVSTDSDLIQFEVSGKYDDMESYDDAQMNISISIKNPEIFGTIFGLNLSGIESISQQGQLSINKARLYYDGNASIGKTKSKTKLTGYLKDGKPVLNGSLNVETLYLADFGINKPDNTTSNVLPIDKPTNEYIFSRDELDLNFLNRANFDYSIKIAELISEQFILQSINGNLKLEDGNFSAPLSLVFEGGHADINLKIREQKIPEYSLTILSDDIQLGPLLSQYQSEVPIQGYTNIELELFARGNSLHTIASSLNGSANFALENARIPRRYVEYLTADVFGWVFSRAGLKETHSNLNCIVMTFNINEGEIESDVIILDGKNISVGGQIDMNLKDETLNIVLIPKQKKRIFSSTTPVKIIGPILKPEVNAIPKKAALQEIGTLALFSGVFVPIRVSEKLWSLLSDDDKVGGGCEKIKAELNDAQ